MYTVGVVQTADQVFVGRASFEQTFRRSVCMDEMGHVLSLVLGYWESSVVVPVYNRYRQRFQHFAKYGIY